MSKHARSTVNCTYYGIASLLVVDFDKSFLVGKILSLEVKIQKHFLSELFSV